MFKKIFLTCLLLLISVTVVYSQYGAEIKLKTDDTYTTDLTSPLSVGKILYIELTGIQGMRSGAGNDSAEVIVTNITHPSFGKINVTLTESATPNVFRGTAVISNATDDNNDKIGAVEGDTLLIRLKGANITVDGNISDWSNCVFYKQIDTSDANYNGGGYTPGQLQEVWLTSDDDFVYLVYKEVGIVDDNVVNCYISFDTIFDVGPGGTSNEGDYAPWWIYFTTPAPPGYPPNYMYGDYCVRAFYSTEGASPGYFGDGSTINKWNGSTWVVTGTNKPAGGFPGDRNKENDDVYVEIAIPFSVIGNPTNICGATFRVVNTSVGFDADLMFDSATPAERPPLYFKPSKYVKTTVSIPPLLVTKYNVSSYIMKPGDTKKTVIAFNILDTYSGHKLQSIKLGNCGSMEFSSDISKVELWEDKDANRQYNTGDTKIADLYYNGTFWTNDTLISNSLEIHNSGSGRNFIITIDISTTARVNKTFQAFLPSEGIKCDNGHSAPSVSITNSGIQTVVITPAPSAEIPQDLKESYIYPNPVKGTKIIKFAKLTKTSTIKIFTIKGELIDTIGKEKITEEGEAEWDFNKYSLAHGIYIVYIKDEQGNERILKFVYLK